MSDGTTSADWQTLAGAAATVKRSQRTILRWAEARYVRRMVARGRVLVRRADVTETERALFDGETPTAHVPERQP